MKGKSVLKMLLLLAAGAIVFFLLAPKRYFIISPDKKQVITVMKPIGFVFHNKLYLIPYKYNNIVVPKDNYLIISLNCGDAPFTINWQPNDSFKFKMYFSCNSALISDKWNGKYLYCQGNPYGFLDSGDKEMYPKYCSYSFTDVMK